jgi:hypothetical protein
MEEYVSGVEQLNVIPGELFFVKLKVTNVSNTREVYTVFVNDPDEKDLPEKEMQLVTDKAEWRYWVTQGKCMAPTSYEILTPSGDLIL